MPHEMRAAGVMPTRTKDLPPFLFSFVFICFCLAVLALRCWVGFSLVASRGYSLVETHGLLIAVASLVAERRL